MKTTENLPKNYQNNPFFVATDGLDLLFKKAQSVGIALAILSGLAFLSSIPTYFMPQPPVDQPAAQTKPEIAPQAQADFPIELAVGIIGLVLVGLLILTFVGIVIRGVSDYTAAQLVRNKTVTLSDALRGVFANFWSYTWVLIVVTVKTILWSLLFIIPGFVMAYRYSLTGVSFFDKKLKGGAASTHSAGLTKGVWLTTFASHSLLNLLTFSAIQPLLMPGTNAVLYRQLVNAKGKPRAHSLSWLTLIAPIVLFIVVGGLLFLTIWALINYSNTTV